jgi:hypothetical protein
VRARHPFFRLAVCVRVAFSAHHRAMALEAVVFSQAGGHFGYGGCVDSPYALPWCDLPGAGFGFEGLLAASVAPGHHQVDEWETASAANKQDQSSEASTEKNKGSVAGRRKRRRTMVVKNKEDMETQRMTHIAVERNRRRQMNEYLAVLRSLMPPSYAHRVRRRARFLLCSSVLISISLTTLLASFVTIGYYHVCNNEMTETRFPELKKIYMPGTRFPHIFAEKKRNDRRHCQKKK